MIRRPPRSPLFPYPPLFRSPVGGRVEEPAVARLPLGVDQRRVADRDLRADLAALPLVRPDRVPAEQEQVERRDRKSTRLNSSHANISYAVFCLKKKDDLDHAFGEVYKELGKQVRVPGFRPGKVPNRVLDPRSSEEHTSELQSRQYLVCRLLLEQ